MKNQLYYNVTRETYHRTLKAALRYPGEVRRLSMVHGMFGSFPTYPGFNTVREADGSPGWRILSNAATAEEKEAMTR